MKITINKQQAIEKLLEDENAGWSIEGAKALVEYLEELEEDIGEEIEFDPIAIRCDYSEMTLEEVLDNYMAIKEDFEEYKERTQQANYPIEEGGKDIIKEIISEYTTIIEVDDNTVIIQDL